MARRILIVVVVAGVRFLLLDNYGHLLVREIPIISNYSSTTVTATSLRAPPKHGSCKN